MGQICSGKKKEKSYGNKFLEPHSFPEHGHYNEHGEWVVVRVKGPNVRSKHGYYNKNGDWMPEHLHTEVVTSAPSFDKEKKVEPPHDAAAAAAQKKFADFWPRCVVVVLGPPGAGKFTQGSRLAETVLHVPRLTDLTTTTTKMTVEQRLDQPDCRMGFVLQGVPRTMEQAEELDAALAKKGERVTRVIRLDVSDDVSKDRLAGRWVHEPSGRTYHEIHAPPPPQENDDDDDDDQMRDRHTGDVLVRRPDGKTKEARNERLKSYYDEMVPVLEHYGKKGLVHVINANQGMEMVGMDIKDALTRKEKGDDNLLGE